MRGRALSRGPRRVSLVSRKSGLYVRARFPVTVCVSLAPGEAEKLAGSALFWTPGYNPVPLGAESRGAGGGAHVLAHARQVRGTPGSGSQLSWQLPLQGTLRGNACA